MSKISQTIATLDPKRRALLAALLKEQGVEASRVVILPSPRGAGVFPLSFAQERLWFLDRLWPGDTSYNLPAALRLSGPLDAGVLGRVFPEIARRHETLRTRFVEREGKPLQAVEPAVEVPLPVIDLAALAGERREAEAKRLAGAHATWPFDLAKAPLLRVALLRLGGESHVVLFNMHHIVSDGWSFGVLNREVGELYESLGQGRASSLPALEVQYVDYAVWQRGLLQGAELERQAGYWRDKLAGAPPVLDLPLDRPRSADPSGEGGQSLLVLGPEIREGLAALARQSGATLFMVLLAAFAALLRRHAGDLPDEVVLGTPIAGRANGQLEKLIGFFVNSLVLRCDLAGDPSFLELLGRVQRTALEAYDHQDVPFEKLVEVLQPERSLAHQPLFQVLFALQNVPKGAVALSSGLQLTPQEFENPTAKLDLSVAFHEGGDRLAGQIEYSADLFDAATVEALGRRFQTLLAGILADPRQRLSALPLLPEAERRQLGLDGLVTVAVEAGPYRLLHETVEDHAARRPEAPAVALGGLALSYAELNARANQLAHFLTSRGIVPGDRVGLALERSPEAVVGILGTLKAGAAYVPLDPAYPPDRLEGMAADAGLALRLTGSNLAAAAGEIAAHSAADPRLDLPSGSLAYILFTSGSTGRPKGVAGAHAGVLNVLEESHRRQPLPPGAVHATWGSFSFDLAVQEMFLAFREGGRLEIVPEAVRVDGRGFARWLAEREIESAFVAPPLLPDLRDFAEGEETGIRLRRVLTGLEAIPERLLARIARAVPGLRFQDGYGPTEATILVTVYEVGGERPAAEVPETDTPLGRPIRNVRLVLLDRDGNPVPRGVAGELAIAGPGLAWGYPGRPDLTAERFRPDPFGTGGGRLYWSGDRVRLRADGLLELIGRVDRQVKIRGFRVEPGEIEAALAALPGVREAAVVVRSVRAGERTLAAFVSPQSPDLALRPADLVAGLRQRLPEPMIPASVTPLPALPHTANGKIDRAALGRLEPLGSRTAERRRAAVPPRTPVEQVLAAIWTEVLGLDPAANPPVGPVGADDNFFELSGHSLLATQVAYRVRQTFGVELPLRRLFERATLSELAREIAAQQGKPGAGREDGLRPLALAGTDPDGPQVVPASLLQEWMWKLQGGPVSPLYNLPSALRARGPLDLAALGHSLHEMRRRHETLRSRFEMRGDRLWQIVEPLEAEAPLPMIDLAALPEVQKIVELYRLANEDAARPFDLTRAPLIRLTVVRMGPLDQALLFNTHHTVSDGWSMEVLERDMAVLYGAFSRGEPSPLAGLPVQYSDFAAWQRRLLEDRRGLDAQLAEWRRRLAGLPPVVTVPTDRPHPADGKLRSDLVTAEMQIGGDVLPALQGLAHATGCSLHMALLAGVEALLYRYTGQEDLIVGSIFAGRDRPELADLIGVFLNLVPLRTDLSGSPTFRALMLRARETVLAAYSLQDTPFSLLLADLFPDRPASRTLLFRVLFNLLSFPVTAEPDGAAGEGLPGDLSFEPMVAVREEARYDLVFEAREGPGFVHFTLKGAADLYKQATLARVAKDFESLLAQAVSDPDIPIDRLLPAPQHRPRPA